MILQSDEHQVIIDDDGNVVRGWDHNYRRLEEGEVILCTDELQNDDCTWSPARPVGQKAPDPNYSSHRVYRRAKVRL